MVDGFIRLKTTIRVPAETSTNEVEESFILAFECLLKGLGAWSPAFALGRDCDPWFAQRIKEQLLPGGLLNEVLFRWTEDLHYAGELLLLVFTWEDGIASQKLGEDTAQ